MIVLHFQNADCVFADPLDDKTIGAGKSYRILSGAGAFQEMKPQCPMSIWLCEGVDGPYDR
jgi:hypothetical protein